jgi:hypothetical protein
MLRKLLLLAIVGLLLLLSMQVTLAAGTEMRKAVLLKGFWYGDGYLADDPRYMDWYVIPSRPVNVYSHPSFTTMIIGEIAAGTRTRIRDIAMEAHPDWFVVSAPAAMSTQDGRITVSKGEPLGLICYIWEGMAVYVRDEVVYVETFAPEFRGLISQEWQSKLNGGSNQWLQVDLPDGAVGWAPRADGQPQLWRGQPKAVGGSANFNTIVFSDERPRFMDMPTLRIVH